MILLIDNYDSFTYNLLHYLGELGADVKVMRNDKLSVKKIAAMPELQGIVISPGPCTPDEAGVSMELIEELSGRFPILGVCLGHEAIGQVFGGKVVRAKEPVHGKVSEIFHEDSVLFKNVPNPFTATRYHSLIVDSATLPKCLKVTAKTKDGTIMALEHTEHKTYGVQFHPESIASECGHDILRNFLAVVG